MGTLFAIYPLLVWGGQGRGSSRTVAAILLGTMILTLALTLTRAGSKADLSMVAAPSLTAAAIAGSLVFNNPSWLLAEPVVISCVLLLTFGLTLRAGAMPMVERFARLQEPELTLPKQRWCRLWTWIWCGFFVCNATIAGLLAAIAPLAWWVAYTTVIVYALMGTLFGSEWVLRRRRFGHG